MDTDFGALRAFFSLVFGTRKSGYIGLGFIDTDMKYDRRGERFFEWPRQAEEMFEAIQIRTQTDNVYYCPQLLESHKRTKDNVKVCTNIWADLDTCHPDRLLVEPNVIIESSPGRFQAVWSLEEPMAPSEAESIAFRIAYYHAAHGADRSGWDLTQLLRVPYTYNFKYANNTAEAPQVTVRRAVKSRYRAEDFIQYPEVKGTKELTLPMPAEFPTEEPLDILSRNRYRTDPRAFGLFDVEPNKDWSASLWRLLMLCFEAGLSREEVFVIARAAKCNKYERDDKPIEWLWRDVCRAWLRNQENVNSVVAQHEQAALVSDEEVKDVEEDKDSFIERYITWATALGDAATQYHQAGAFAILSTLLSGNIRIPTSWGTILPNLWFMILGDTTLTRKTTAMDTAADLLLEIDEDYLLATDGSIEGLLTAMSLRPGKPSLFLKDEISGILEAMTKKDYLAGMSETLTKMYDGKPFKRVLRKEIVSVSRPIMVILSGGILGRVQSVLSHEDVSSGFVPRFIFVTAISDVQKVKPLGPPTYRDMTGREEILGEMRRLADFYQQTIPMRVDGQGITLEKRKEFDAELTRDAWVRYNDLEDRLLKAGMATERPELMIPVYARLSISTLKAATLIAASRQRDEKVVVDEVDIVRAIKYADGWRAYANEVINGIGRNATERELQKIHQAIIRHPNITRGKLMQAYHLTSRQADAIFNTLEDRGLVTGTRVGRGMAYHAVG